MTPHVYPPTILKSVYLGEALWKQSVTAFAYLQVRAAGHRVWRTIACCAHPVLVASSCWYYICSTDACDAMPWHMSLLRCTHALSTACCPQTKGYCHNGFCKKFPVVVGETGSAFETSQDKQWLNDFADFMNAQVGLPARHLPGLHRPDRARRPPAIASRVHCLPSPQARFPSLLDAPVACLMLLPPTWS